MALVQHPFIMFLERVVESLGREEPMVKFFGVHVSWALLAQVATAAVPVISFLSTRVTLQDSVIPR